MPGPIIQALSLPQWGLEATTAPNVPGALVAATKKMAVKDFLITPTDTVIRDQILKGLVIGNRGNEIIGERGTDWEVPETPLVFDEFHYWQGMALIRPTKTGAGPFVWTSTLDPTIVQARDLRTIEFQYNDGTNVIGYRMGASHLKELEIIGAPNSPVRFRASGSARRLQLNAITAALALFSIQEVPMSLSKVFIDSTWATRGNTQITGQVTGWRFKLNTGLKGQNTADGASDQDLRVVLLDSDELKWTIEIDIKANLNTGQWQTEKTAAEALTLRAVQIQASITGAVAYDLKIQALAKHTAGSLFPKEREGDEVKCTLTLEGSTDDTNVMAMIVTNNITAAIA